MSANGGVPSSPRQILALAERNVLAFRVLIALGEAEVDDVNIVLGVVAASDQEIVWLNVAVDNPFFVDFLNALDLRNGEE